jgi:flagellar hook-associated protein 3 FlgL
MSITSIGDLAQSLQLRREMARLNGDLQRLSTELATGETTDLAGRVRGDFRALAGLERSLSSLAAFEVAVNEASLAAEAGQDILGRIAADAGTLSSSLILVQEATDAQLTASTGAAARQRFAAAVTGLNTNVAGRTLFAGQAFDRPALADAETVLADLATAVGPAATAADVLAAVDAYFAPGGAFESTSYLGSSTAADPVPLGDGSTTEPFRRATDPEIVEVLKGLATAALIDLNVLAAAPDERAALARTAGERLLTAEAGLVAARAELGVSQERIESARSRIGAERAAYEIARAEIREADPTETAMQLRQAEMQLQSLYVITGRLSGLSLTNYLR